MSKVMPLEETLNPTGLLRFREKKAKKSPGRTGANQPGRKLVHLAGRGGLVLHNLRIASKNRVAEHVM
jgi:hypothetical protein